MKKPLILISIDHKWRDLAGYVYAKILLEKKGYNVLLIRNGLEKYYSDILNPDAIVMIHLYDKNREKIIEDFKKRNISVFLMPTEGIPTLEKMRKLAAGYFNNFTNIDIHFVWNNEIKKIMLKNKTLNSDKIYVTGVPRFDFYVNSLNKILMTRAEFFQKYNLKNDDYKIITWATNFTNAGFYKKNMSFLKKDWRKLQVDKILNPEEIAYKDHVSREILFNNVVKLSNEIQDAYLIIKLHPSEEHIYYDKKLNNLTKNIRNRIRIIRQEYIWDVLNNTDILLKRSCTTGVEAWALNKPTIELCLNPDEWYYSKEHASGSIVVKNYISLKKYVLYYLNGGKISESLLRKRKEFIKKWCYNLDGKSTERFINRIDEHLKKKQVKVKRYKFCDKLTWEYLKSFLITSFMEITRFKIHDLKVYGLYGKIDKLGRIDKYFHRKDEKYWYKRIWRVLNEKNYK